MNYDNLVSNSENQINVIHNNVNSNYFIINIKFDFNTNLIYDINKYITIKNQYLIIIQKWIKTILNKYSIMSNWVVYIKNLNFEYFRVFIYLNSLNYSNMDTKNIIYLTDMINYENIFKINIKDFVKHFNISELKVLIDLELKLISDSLSEASNSLSEVSISLSEASNSLSEDSNSLSEASNSLSEASNSLSEASNLNTFNIIDMHFFEMNQLSIEQKNNLQISKFDEMINNNKYKFITDIGISGINKVTFINELLKLLYINNSYDTCIYFNNTHNIYNDKLFTKIKEKNKFYWVDYNENDINIKYNLLKLLFNY